MLAPSLCTTMMLFIRALPLASILENLFGSLSILLKATSAEQSEPPNGLSPPSHPDILALTLTISLSPFLTSKDSDEPMPTSIIS